MIVACIVHATYWEPILFADADPKEYGPFRIVQHNWDATIAQRFLGDDERFPRMVAWE